MPCRRRTPNGCAGCRLAGGFTYDNGVHIWTQERDGTCILQFLVGDLQDGCNSVDFGSADITIELFLNGSPLSVTFLPLSPSILRGGGVYWEKYKPEANDVYIATVTWVCSTETVVREFSITIPDPANVDCDCCAEREIGYIVIDGFTDEFAVLNGTFAAVPTGPEPNCCWNFTGIPAAPDMPTDPCGIRTGPTTVNIPPECLFAVPPSGIDPFTGIGYYYYPGTGAIVGGSSSSVCIGVSGPGEVTTIKVRYTYSYARRRPADVTIANPEGCIEFGGGGALGYEVVFTFDCESGLATISSNSFPSQSPTLTIHFDV